MNPDVTRLACDDLSTRISPDIMMALVQEHEIVDPQDIHSLELRRGTLGWKVLIAPAIIKNSKPSGGVAVLVRNYLVAPARAVRLDLKFLESSLSGAKSPKKVRTIR